MSTQFSQMNRRHAPRGIGAIAVGGARAPSALLDAAAQDHPAPAAPTKPFTSKPVTCILLGAGNRGNTYAAWSQQFPGQMKVVGVAEPIPSRQEKLAALYTLPPERRCTSGHGGGDYGVMEAFIKATQHQDVLCIASSLEVSMENHRIAFEAERSRLEKRTVML